MRTQGNSLQWWSTFRLRPARNLWLLSMCLVPAIGCDNPADRSQAQMVPGDLFRLHCSTCHGDGTGNGHVAATLKVKPRNLKHHEWQSSVSDEHIRRVIRSGGAAVKLSQEMPGFADKLTEKQIEQLTAYIRSWAM